jgi:hypothetical protein
MMKSQSWSRATTLLALIAIVGIADYLLNLAALHFLRPDVNLFRPHQQLRRGTLWVPSYHRQHWQRRSCACTDGRALSRYRATREILRRGSPPERARARSTH